MRSEVHPKLEKGRVTSGLMASDESFGLRGAFRVSYKFAAILKKGSAPLTIVSSGSREEGDPDDDVYNWEHVSVSLPNRCPTWEEMCWVKDLFWSDDEVVVQFHPAKENYVNQHKYCLHLWKHIKEIPMPNKMTVGL